MTMALRLLPWAYLVGLYHRVIAWNGAWEVSRTSGVPGEMECAQLVNMVAAPLIEALADEIGRRTKTKRGHKKGGKDGQIQNKAA